MAICLLKYCLFDETIYNYSVIFYEFTYACNFFFELKKFPTILDILEEESRDWVGIRSLTGANASGWKFQDSFYGNFNSGRQPAMDTAWGRRVYDQYEIEFEVDKPKHSYLTEPPNSGMVKFGYKTEHVERQKLRKTLGKSQMSLFVQKIDNE